MNELVRLEVDILVVLGWDLTFGLEELEEVARLCLKEGEKEGLVEKAEELDCPPTLVVEPIKDEEQGAAEDLSRTPLLPATLPRNLPSPLECPAPLPAKSTNSSLSTSPEVFTAPGSIGSGSPPSSVGGDSGDEAAVILKSKDSAETVRRMEAMSFGGPGVVGVCS